ncbi:MAG: hypothetical protein JWO98_551 [Frankiales bacterium]|nr:hypothetical protein [Frankiales bacterium]
MGDESLVSEAALAAYDAASARTFGREMVEAATPAAEWRTGPAGEMTAAEYDDQAGVSFGRFVGAQESAARARVAETRRQLAVERQLLERAARIGWSATVHMATGGDRIVAESVRARAVDAQSPAPSGALTESGAGRRDNLREVRSWRPNLVEGGR